MEEGESARLLADCLDNFGAPVTYIDAPQTGCAIDVAPAVVVPNMNTRSLRHNSRTGFLVIVKLSERMKEGALVKLLKGQIMGWVA